MIEVESEVTAELSAEQVVDVPLAMNNVHDLYTWALNPIKDDILVHWEAAISLPQVVSVTAGVGMAAEHLKMVDEQVDKSVGGGLVISGDVGPDFEQFLPGLAAEAIRHPFKPEARSARASSFSLAARSGSVSSE